jgi:hypothetical protein
MDLFRQGKKEHHQQGNVGRNQGEKRQPENREARTINTKLSNENSSIINEQLGMRSEELKRMFFFHSSLLIPHSSFFKLLF